MTGILSSINDVSGLAIWLGLDVTAKATVILLLAVVVNRLLNGRVLARAAVWNALLVGLILLPAATAFFPRLRICCLPPAPPEATVEIPADTIVPNEVPPAPAASESPWPLSVDPGEGFSPAELPAVTVDQEPLEDQSEAVAAAEDGLSDAFGPSPIRSHGPSFILFAYLLGVAALALRLVASFLAVRRLRGQSILVDDSTWSAALASWRERLGIRQPVQLALSAAVNVPIQIGWLSPMVILPAEMIGSLDPSRHGSILLHELAHIRRRDYAWQILLKLVQIVYWPHPLVWLAGRMIGANREQVCDDLCVHHSSNAGQYRATLLEVASALVRRPAASLGIAMARTSKIGGRLDRIDRGCRLSRCLARWPVRLAIIAIVLASACVIAPVELAHREAEPGTPGAGDGKPTTSAAAESSESREAVANRTAPLPPSAIPPLWVSILVRSPIRSFEECRLNEQIDYVPGGEAFGEIRSCEIEIRPVRDRQQVVRLPFERSGITTAIGDKGRRQRGQHVYGLPLSEATEATKAALQSLYRLPGGSYEMVLFVNGVRCSNIAAFTVDPMFDPAAAPPLELTVIEPGPAAAWPRLGLRVTGFTPGVPEFTGESVLGAPLIIDGADHQRTRLAFVGDFTRPVTPELPMVCILDIADYPPRPDPDRSHSVKVRVGKYESNAVTITPAQSPGARPVAAAPPGEEALGPNERWQYFVLIVEDKDRLTFEGQPTTWDDLPKLLEKLPDREHTTLCYAVASEPPTITLRERNDIVGKLTNRALSLQRQYGFTGVSYVGVHPLGSKGDKPQRVPIEAPPVSTAPATPTVSALPAATSPAEESVGPNERWQYFVLIVVGKDGLTFEGTLTTWDDLPKLLEKVPDRGDTALCYAMASDEATVQGKNDADLRVLLLSQEFGFGYASDTGIHPLGTRGDKPQRVPMTNKSAAGGSGTSAKQVEKVFLIRNPEVEPPVMLGVDRTGKVLFEVPGGRYSPGFSEGLAAVQMGDLKSARWGYIDQTGRWVIPARFQSACSFDGELARAKLDDKFGFINRKGQWVIEPQYSAARDFYDGRAAAKKDGQWVYIDPNGKVVFETRMDDRSVSPFREGLVRIRVAGKWGHVDTSGKMVIESKFDDAGGFSEGLAAVKVGEKWGFIDRQGQLIIQPQFDGATMFHEGLAAVNLGGHRLSGRWPTPASAEGQLDGGWGFIDKQGRLVIKPDWYQVEFFSDGLATFSVLQVKDAVGPFVTQDTQTGYMNRAGEVVIKPQFDSAGRFAGGLARATIKGKLNGLIDKTGRVIFNAYDYQSAAKAAESRPATTPEDAAAQARRETLKEKLAWGRAEGGLQCRLVIPYEGEGPPKLAPNKATMARLLVRNVSDQPITLAEQNETSARVMLVDDWLIGLELLVRAQGSVSRFFRPDDQGHYWSQIGDSPAVRTIKPGQVHGFTVNLEKLVNDQGTNLFTMRGPCALQASLHPVRSERSASSAWVGSISSSQVVVEIADDAPAPPLAWGGMRVGTELERMFFDDGNSQLTIDTSGSKLRLRRNQRELLLAISGGRLSARFRSPSLGSIEEPPPKVMVENPFGWSDPSASGLPLVIDVQDGKLRFRNWESMPVFFEVRDGRVRMSSPAAPAVVEFENLSVEFDKPGLAFWRDGQFETKRWTPIDDSTIRLEDAPETKPAPAVTTQPAPIM